MTIIILEEILLSYRTYTTKGFSEERLRDITIQKSYIALNKSILIEVSVFEKGLTNAKTKLGSQGLRS